MLSCASPCSLDSICLKVGDGGTGSPKLHPSNWSSVQMTDWALMKFGSNMSPAIFSLVARRIKSLEVMLATGI